MQSINATNNNIMSSKKNTSIVAQESSFPLSLVGREVETMSFDDVDITLLATSYAVALYCEQEAIESILMAIENIPSFVNMQAYQGARSFIIIESAQELDDTVITAIAKNCHVSDVHVLKRRS